MVGWHHPLKGHEFEQAPVDSEGQGRLACCSPWGHKESDMTEGLNNDSYKALDPRYVGSNSQDFQEVLYKWLAHKSTPQIVTITIIINNIYLL